MRTIIYGVGAIGGVIAAALVDSGREVVGIARGRMLEAIRAEGLRMRGFRGDVHARFDCVAGPDEIEFRPDDAILLTMKSQDTEPALAALRAAGVRDQPIFCCQNGVENERRALRYFPNVHGVMMMMPASYLEPGEVTINIKPSYGVFDIGRFPGGSDADDAALAEALTDAHIMTFAHDDVMAFKYGKLLMNLSNILEATLGSKADKGDLPKRLTAEARAVYAAAGIAPADVFNDPRRDQYMQKLDMPGEVRLGGSTTQSFARGASSLETDYLNGEISLLGRIHGVPTPLNDGVTALSQDLLASGHRPGDMTLEALRARLGA